MTYKDRIAANGPKKLLALDGGGILGVLSLEYLARIEELLRAKVGKGDPNFVLADYFDYIAGTSTGAIIAAGLSLGFPVSKIKSFYLDDGETMFERAWLFQTLSFKYTQENLSGLLKKTFGADTTLGSDRLRTLLMVVLRNSTTDSPWPLSNNPEAKYNDCTRGDCNLNLPLWQVVRASTAAPTYFPPEEVHFPAKGESDKAYSFVFVDGGVTVYNNPAWQLFQMATVGCYGLEWPAGEDKMLVVSIGTGTAPNANANLKPGEMNLLYNASKIPSALMAAAVAQQDFNCRVFGRCLFGDEIDSEVGDMVGPKGSGPVDPKLFTYLRYNVDLTRKGLDALGFTTLVPESVQQMDAVNQRFTLRDIGHAAAARNVKEEHFRRFF